MIFDPHTSYLPGATPQQPGLRINFTNKNMYEQFPDQFAAYKLFGCDFENHFDGTLFRFPLRSATTAPLSEIKNEPYSEESLDALLASFIAFAPQTLLFLRGVKQIEVYTKDGPDSEAQLLYSAAATGLGDNFTMDRERATRFVTGSPEKPLTINAFQSSLSSTAEEELPRSTWVSSLHSPSEKELASTHKPRMLSDVV